MLMNKHYAGTKVYWHANLVNDFAVEWNSHGAEEQTGVLVGFGSCVDCDVAAWNHFGRIPVLCKLY
jgi:hypothetical protein